MALHGMPYTASLTPDLFAWATVPPVVVYYNTFDRPGDTQPVADKRGQVAECLDKTINSLHKGMYVLGGFALSQSVDVLPLQAVLLGGAGACAVRALVFYMKAAETTRSLIKNKQGSDFDGFAMLQHCEDLEITPLDEG